MADFDISPFEDLINCCRPADYAFLHKYKGYGVIDSECTVNIWVEKDKVMVLFIDIGIGTSTINSAEILINEIFSQCLSKLGYHANDCLFLETSEYRKRKSDLLIPKWAETLSDVSVAVNGTYYMKTIRELKCKGVEFKSLNKFL